MRAETDKEDTEQQEKMAVATADRAQKTTTAYEAQDVILTKPRSRPRAKPPNIKKS